MITKEIIRKDQGRVRIEETVEIEDVKIQIYVVKEVRIIKIAEGSSSVQKVGIEGIVWIGIFLITSNCEVVHVGGDFKMVLLKINEVLRTFVLKEGADKVLKVWTVEKVINGGNLREPKEA